MKKISEKQLYKDLCKAFFNLYLVEHGGIPNQPLLCMLWMSGRIDEFTKEIERQVKCITPTT